MRWMQMKDAATEAAGALYSRRAAVYVRLVGLIGYQAGLERIFAMSMAQALRPHAKALDAGCGAGAVTFAMLGAFERARIPRGVIDAFDLTPAMLDLFRRKLRRAKVSDVRLCQADLFDLSGFPEDWVDYDLVVSSGMLEYLPRDRLSEGLAVLRSRLAADGHLLMFISRKNAFNRLAMERWWRANCYDRAEIGAALRAAGFTTVSFHEFPKPFCFLNSWGFAIQASCIPSGDCAAVLDVPLTSH